MDVLTLDIEGCELTVLQDLNESLCDGTQRPIVYLELHEPFYRSGDLEWLRKQFVEEWGYQIQTVQPGYWLCLPKAVGLGESAQPTDIEQRAHACSG